MKTLTDNVAAQSQGGGDQLHQELSTSGREEQDFTPRTYLRLSCEQDLTKPLP
jgi:hypothetical protein